MCWPLSTRSPVPGSVNAVARPPSPGRASTTSTRAPRSASAVAALNPAHPPPTTITSNDLSGINQQWRRSLSAVALAKVDSCPGGTPEPDRRQLGPRPDGERDSRAHELRHANHFAKDVVAALLDALEDLEVDTAHDLRRHQPAGLVVRHRLCGDGEELPRALAFVRQQPADLSGHAAGTQRVLGHAKPRQILPGQVDPIALEIDANVTNDVGHLQRQAEVVGVLARAGIAAAENLDADHSHRRRDATAIAD